MACLQPLRSLVGEEEVALDFAGVDPPCSYREKEMAAKYISAEWEQQFSRKILQWLEVTCAKHIKARG